MKMTEEAKQGYNADHGSKCPYLASSASSMAWHVGQWMAMTGRSEPYDCRTGRGYTMHVNGMLVDVKHEKKVERLK